MIVAPSRLRRLIPSRIELRDWGSTATVGYGQPFDCAHLLELYARDPHAAVERLTDEIALHIRDLVVEAEPLDESELVRKIDRIYRAAKGLPDDATARLARRQLIAERLLPALQADHPALYDDLVETVRRYDRRLGRFGLSEGVVGGQPGRSVVARFAVRESLILLALSPILVAGSVVFAAPYFLIKWLTTRVIPIALEEQATYKVFGGMLIYPPWVALVAGVAGRTWGAASGWGVALLLPLLAVASLLASEREASVWDTVTSYFAWQRLSPGAARAMVSQRRAIAETVDHLTEYLRLADAPATQASGPQAG